MTDCIETLKSELRQTRIQKERFAREEVLLDAQVREAKARRNAIAGQLKVSDHAIIRYLERVKKMDIDMIRQEIIKDMQSAEHKGGEQYSCSGYTVIIRNDGEVIGTITTIITDD